MPDRSAMLPVRMQDVARAAGVHQTTVSRALRNDPRLPAETCRRLQRLAEKMGYRPHPLVSALIAQRRARHPPRFETTIAFVVRDVLGESGEQHLAGARSMAQRAGYGLELFTLSVGDLTEQRLNSMLVARNVRGLVIASLPEARGRFELDWSRFCTAVIEYTFDSPAFDRVVHDSYGGMRTILSECRRRGLRRVGLTLATVGHERTERLNGAAYWSEQKAERFFAAIPPLIQPGWEAARFTEWHRRHRPEVVVTSNALLHSVLDWCAERRLRPGRDIHVLNVNVMPGEGVSGVVQNHFAIGATATRLVTEKLSHNESGIPLLRTTTLTPGTWFEGETLRPA
ncbi:MAG: LacI family DNA-binding transcriptional regulator [Verrucomicrobia bacterium]|nr:LacI family DNA-binding transcriptional regulator [Verrucomicrobiota bacterium]